MRPSGLLILMSIPFPSQRSLPNPCAHMHQRHPESLPKGKDATLCLPSPTARNGDARMDRHHLNPNRKGKSLEPLVRKAGWERMIRHLGKSVDWRCFT